ncbi:hypothetical protein JVT61DRAFT_15001 [Boletus reticuloceps]|uniref:Uncharacterized protein n=1 Tax=Boletus reticuloceps TaxID=495285 RepID=A0A8I2YCH1_9AGAM|nr:hypothetical protein JVT61DRAFT_15001 [Boletus reticuloceps]
MSESSNMAVAWNPETNAVNPSHNEDKEDTRKKGNRKARKRDSSAKENPEMAAARKQCLTIAKYIPHGLDVFCNLHEVFQVIVLMDQVADSDNQENEGLQTAAQKILGKIDERTGVRYRRTFHYVTILAPHLLTLIGNKTKGVELDNLIKEMQAEITHIRTEDGSRLRKVVGSYAAPHPNKQVVQPPISSESKAGRARMRFNHPQLGQILCPVKYLQDSLQKWFEDPSDTMKVTANVWPAYLYPGKTPGSEYDPKEISRGLFKGYLMEHISII